MTKAIRIHTNGGPEVMKWEDVPTPEPGPGEALIHHHAVGLNYIDVYFRTGLYKAPSMPLIIGQEGAGTVTAVGAGVTLVQPGDRVAYAGPMRGDDAAGDDSTIPRAEDLSGEGRRYHRGARSGWWGWADPDPMGAPSGRDG